MALTFELCPYMIVNCLNYLLIAVNKVNFYKISEKEQNCAFSANLDLVNLSSFFLHRAKC